MMMHIRDCPGTTATFDVCPFPWCRKVKHSLYHLVSCPEPELCEICSPSDISHNLGALQGLNEFRLQKRKEDVERQEKAAEKKAKATKGATAQQKNQLQPVVKPSASPPCRPATPVFPAVPKVVTTCSPTKNPPATNAGLKGEQILVSTAKPLSAKSPTPQYSELQVTAVKEESESSDLSAQKADDEAVDDSACVQVKSPTSQPPFLKVESSCLEGAAAVPVKGGPLIVIARDGWPTLPEQPELLTNEVILVDSGSSWLSD
jgi:hypothetical protein